MAPTVVLITGGNRGLGEGLVKRFLTLPDHVSTVQIEPTDEDGGVEVAEH